MPFQEHRREASHRVDLHHSRLLMNGDQASMPLAVHAHDCWIDIFCYFIRIKLL